MVHSPPSSGPSSPVLSSVQPPDGNSLNFTADEFVPRSLSVPSSPNLSPSSPSFVPRVTKAEGRRKGASHGRQRANSDTKNSGFGFTWSVFVDCLPCVVDKNAKKTEMSEGTFRDQMQCLGGFNSKDVFDKRFLHRLDQVKSSGLACRVFRSGVRPVWEDKRNCGVGAGKWVIQGGDETIVTTAFHAILDQLVKEGQATTGVNGSVFACKRGQHVVMLWTKAHPKGSKSDDPFSIRELVSQISAQIGYPLITSFKQHGKKGRTHKSNSRSVPSSPMLQSARSPKTQAHKGRRSPCLSPTLPSPRTGKHSGKNSPWSRDSDYKGSPKMSPILLSSPIMEGPPEFELSC